MLVEVLRAGDLFNAPGFFGLPAVGLQLVGLSDGAIDILTGAQLLQLLRSRNCSSCSRSSSVAATRAVSSGTAIGNLISRRVMAGLSAALLRRHPTADIPDYFSVGL
jgi:hypothetical protein